MCSYELIPGSLRRTQDLALRAARTSQALTISALDHADPSSAAARGLLGRSVELTCALVGQPVAALVDEQYALVEQLIRLHREFVQRLFEVLEPRDQADVQLPHRMLASVARMHAS